MGIREKLNENPMITTVLTIVIMVAAAAFLVMRWMNHTTATGPRFPSKDYFSDDDGATWFIDDAGNIPPFDHNGKQAFRARLFRCGNGKPFVQCLESFDEESKQKINEMIQAQKLTPIAAQFMFNNESLMVKKPGDKEWVKLKPGDAAAAKAWSDIISPKCPDGISTPLPVSPEENVQP